MMKHLGPPGNYRMGPGKWLERDTSIEERIKCDIYYIENWTFLLTSRSCS